MTDDYIRHTFTLLFDIPAATAANPDAMADTLNAAVSRITELIEADARLQGLLRASGIEYGWEVGSWE